jgi:hypothetical protein
VGAAGLAQTSAAFGIAAASHGGAAMRTLLIALLATASLGIVELSAQNLTVVIHDPTGTVADTPITSSYQFADTPVDLGSSVVLRVSDSAGFPVNIVDILVGSAAGSANSSPNFTITGLVVDKTLSTSAGSFEDVTTTFAPSSQGALTGYLQIVYQVENGCTTTCPSQTLAVSTLQGNGLAPTFVLSYPGTNGTVALQPNSPTALNFGNVSTSANTAIIFTITNETGTDVAPPAVTLVTQVFNSTAFALNTTGLAASIPAGGTGSFNITFAPGQTGLTTATLMLGSLPFPIQGTGIVVADIDALQISYVDSSGVRILPQAATPISFGQVVTGTDAPATLNFTVTNPITSWNAVSLQTLAVSGAGFALASAPTAPLSIAVGQTITFSAVFSPTGAGAYPGTLAIGTRIFSLTGSSISSALPDATLQVDLEPLVSGQQAHLSIQLSSASSVTAIGQLALTFAPSVTGVQDDPAILFLATSGRQLQVNVAASAVAATYNGQTAITFQTGTTAGVITFTLTFPNKAPISQSFTIAPAKIDVTTSSAVRQSPNLVVTLSGFDNTYSAGQLSFNFYDTSGKLMTPSALTVNATAAFSKYFASSTVGSAFSVQASFPVKGDVKTVGSVTVQMTNASGTTSTPETFQ